MTPAINAVHECGATFTLNNHSPQLSEQDQQTNLQNVMECFDTSITTTQANEPLRGRVAFRATTPDYIPIVGGLSGEAEFNAQFSGLANNARLQHDEPARLLPGFFMNTGYGSHGFTLAPLLSHSIANQLAGLPSPLGERLRMATAPNRFLLRKLIRS